VNIRNVPGLANCFKVQPFLHTPSETNKKKKMTGTANMLGSLIKTAAAQTKARRKIK
jgi:hypothetical protein